MKGCIQEITNFILIAYLIGNSFLIFQSGIISLDLVSKWIERIITNFSNNYYLLSPIREKATDNNRITVSALLEDF